MYSFFRVNDPILIGFDEKKDKLSLTIQISSIHNPVKIRETTLWVTKQSHSIYIPDDDEEHSEGVFMKRQKKNDKDKNK